MLACFWLVQKQRFLLLTVYQCESSFYLWYFAHACELMLFLMKQHKARYLEKKLEN